jgi:SH3-like domain-containing protein
MVARFGHGREAAEVITAVVWYQAAGPAAAPLPPGDGLLVRVKAEVSAGLRLRAAASTSSQALATELPGTLLRCLEAEDDVFAKIGVADQWLRVRDSNGLEGYVAAWYVELLEEAPLPQPTGGGLKVYVAQSAAETGLRLRAAPNTTASILATLSVGAELTVLEAEAQAKAKVGQNGQWLNVREPGGKTGYVAAWYVELTLAPAPVSTPGALVVFVSSQATAGLNLREKPNATAKVIKVLSAGTRLEALDPADVVNARIGVMDQWLNVKDPLGATGYVAAWYVTN